jgi:hypothetical protein
MTPFPGDDAYLIENDLAEGLGGLIPENRKGDAS